MTTFNQQRPDNRLNNAILIGLAILAAVLIFTACKSTKSTTNTQTDQTKITADTSKSEGSKQISDSNSVQKDNGSYGKLYLFSGQSVPNMPGFPNIKIDNSKPTPCPTDKPTAVYEFGTYNKDKSTSVKKSSYTEYDTWQHWNVYHNYDVVKTVTKTVETKSAFSIWPYLIVLGIGVVGGFWLSKFLSPATLINEAESEYNKVKNNLLKKL